MAESNQPSWLIKPGDGEARGAVPMVATPPAPRLPIAVRVAVKDDLPFIDQLQRMHSHMVGWTPTKQFEANIEAGHILIAEEFTTEHTEGTESNAESDGIDSAHPSATSATSAVKRIGYCIARDQYMKRDDVGIVYQLNVLPLRQRHLVGATLIKVVFERAAYGCRLFSCWCAQDIQANYFWESIGFMPLAFRTGSRAKQRIHIFWQRRVRDDDDCTPYWFPSQTTGGAVAEDRLVLPIPPGTHWRDAKPVVLPGLPPRQEAAAEVSKLLPGGAPVKSRPEQPKVTRAQAAAIARSKSKHLNAVPQGKAAIVTSGGVRYIERADAPPLEEIAPPKPKRPRKERQKNDPKYVAAARELRDRFLEQVNTARLLPGAQGKYDVSRSLEAAPSQLDSTPRLEAA
ncbi:MAG: hypothetical protein IT445_14985 [Phycisphaeraceae bacterium]|nr:hypothetical protein [Phycisphaeraceae bacterium]